MNVCTFTENLASEYFTYVKYNLFQIFRPKKLTTYSRNNSLFSCIILNNWVVHCLLWFSGFQLIKKWLGSVYSERVFNPVSSPFTTSIHYQPHVPFLKYRRSKQLSETIAVLCCPVNDNMPSNSQMCYKDQFFIIWLHCVIKCLKVRITLCCLRWQMKLIERDAVVQTQIFNLDARNAGQIIMCNVTSWLRLS